MWKGRDPPFVVDSLLDALVSLLRVDAARVRLDGLPGGRPLDVWCPRGPEPPAIDRPAASDERGRRRAAGDRAGAPVLWVAVAPERVRGTGMRVEVASARSNFPTDAERFVLHATVEQAALAIEAATVLDRERVERAAAERARADAEARAPRSSRLTERCRSTPTRSRPSTARSRSSPPSATGC